MLRKYAKAEVIGLKSSPKAIEGASLSRFASFDEYKTDDDFLYVRARAISSRVNANNDGWPTVELAGGKDAWEDMNSKHTATEGFTVESKKGSKTGFSTFIGKPIFVDHHNSDPKRARGVIVDSKFRVLDQKTAAKDDYWSSGKAHEAHLPASEVELLMEVDAKTFPKLAQAIVSGDIDGFSMGCDVDFTKCSHCGNEASAPSEYCSHIQAKGADHDYHESDGSKTSKKSYEDCYGPAFFEISAVFDPADETALTKEVISSINHEGEGKLARTASKLAMPGVPQDELSHSPNPVHTLRDEKICPVCGSNMDDIKCSVCGFEEPPKQFQNPDLSQHVNTAQPTGEIDSLADPNPGAFGPTRNQAPAQMVSSDGSKTTSAMLTARALIEAAAKTKEITHIMSDETKTAAEPTDPVAKPDVRTDVTDQGGILDASNEAASKPDKKETLDAHATGDDSGFKANDKIKGTPKGTDTFDGKHQLPSAVSSKDEDDKADEEEPEVEKESSEDPDEKAEKTAAEPVDPVGKADKRIDVTEPPHDQVGDSTKTWSGTDGNGVTKQQNPVTDKASSNMVSIAAIQLADAEVEMGLIQASQKYARLAELADTSDLEIAAEFRTISKVRTANAGRKLATGPSGLGRVPSLSRGSSVTPSNTSSEVTQEVYDAGLFSR